MEVSRGYLAVVMLAMVLCSFLSSSSSSSSSCNPYDWDNGHLLSEISSGIRTVICGTFELLS